MTTPHITPEALDGATATYNADPFYIETPEAVSALAADINAGTIEIITPDSPDFATWAARLDFGAGCWPRRIHVAKDNSGAEVCAFVLADDNPFLTEPPQTHTFESYAKWRALQSKGTSFEWNYEDCKDCLEDFAAENKRKSWDDLIDEFEDLPDWI